mgnify:CR=1 FL=1
MTLSHSDQLGADAPATQGFAELGVDDSVTSALAARGITAPFPIQELAIPIALTGADLIGQARTGTGKTLAFAIPILQRITLPGDANFPTFTGYGKPQALVMTPTRELALQVGGDLAMAGTKRGARVSTLYGGVGYDEQLAALAEGVDVVVGTPGRLLDLAQRRALDLSHVGIMVLDEADEMLDLGFLPDVERLISMTSPDRQSLLFSATMPAVIVALARTHLRQPVHVRAEGRDAQATVPETTQFVYQAHELDKPEILGRLLQSPSLEKMMVFTRTKRAAQRLADELADRGFPVASIHGDLNQTQREKALKRFRTGRIKALVATDVAARGIDVSGVSHVVNYEVPDDAKQYVHRIGRTGRAGNTGIAITLVDWQDITRWRVINKALNLDLANPPETYSTSPHLLTDLDIPADAQGRIRQASVDAEHTEHKNDHKHDRGGTEPDRKAHHHDRDKPAMSAPGETEGHGARPHRRRKRTRNGKPISSDATNVDATTDSTPLEPVGDAPAPGRLSNPGERAPQEQPASAATE